ncbi:peptidase S8/S53 domain-containing protein [Chlamydoabsidia padenii]|nr:peptidase S8/S53 domain-containing protein [Chlamydoabsidia padenii]
MWRIFGCRGDTDDDIILAAADMAANAGMDVINLSLGGGVSAWGEDALAVALSNLADRGIVVVVAHGNEGRDGIARTPSPAIGEHVLAVGSVDNANKLGHLLRVYHKGYELGSYEYTLTDGSQFVLNGTDIEFTTLIPRLTESNETNEMGCHPIMQDIINKVVLVKRGGCNFGQKAMQVQNAGGVGILIYNTDMNEEPVTIDLRRYFRVRIPVASLNGQDGLSLLRHYYGANDTKQMTMKFISEVMPIKNVGLMSVFSTWGPDPELHVKPDIAGVGGHMYSTFPMEMGAYTTMSGTSMATPYVSGCIALLMEAIGKKSPESIVRHLLNYAKPVYSSDGVNLESMAKQGSGLIQIYDSIMASTNVVPYKIPLNDTDHFRTSTELTIENTSNYTKKIYQLNHIPSLAVSGYNFKKSAVPTKQGKYKVTSGSVQFESETIVLGPLEKKNITVHFEQPSLEQQNNTDPVPPLVYGGFLELLQVEENGDAMNDKSIHVPYFGVLGNQRDLPIFDTIQGYPYIGNGSGKRIQPDKTSNNTSPVYNFNQGEKLHLYVRLGSPTALLKCELMKDDKVVGYVSRFHNAWVPRNDNSHDNYDYSINWNGHVAMDYRKSLSPSAAAAAAALAAEERGLPPTIKTHPAEPGIYHLRLSALKIFGDSELDNDWETWNSFDFRIE